MAVPHIATPPDKKAQHAPLCSSKLQMHRGW